MRQADKTLLAESVVRVPTTIGVDFQQIRADGPMLFSVNAGISAHDALEHASNLMELTQRLLFDVGTDTKADSADKAMASYHIGEMVKALVDSVAQTPSTS